MSEYTPTRNEMLTALVIYRATQREKPPRIEDLATPEQAKRYLGEAERGLAEVERAAAVRALEEAADGIESRRNEPGLVHLDVRYAGYYTGIRSGMESDSKALRVRAAEIREGKNDE